MNEQALKERLKYISKSRGHTFNQVWRSLLLERFLVRLSLSACKNKFVFTGGLFLSYCIPIDRETQDIDFATQLEASQAEDILTAVKGICQSSVNDGFTYSPIRDVIIIAAVGVGGRPR